MIILNISKYILIYKIYFDIFSKNTKFVFMLYNL